MQQWRHTSCGAKIIALTKGGKFVPIATTTQISKSWALSCNWIKIKSLRWISTLLTFIWPFGADFGWMQNYKYNESVITNVMWKLSTSGWTTVSYVICLLWNTLVKTRAWICVVMATADSSCILKWFSTIRAQCSTTILFALLFSQKVITVSITTHELKTFACFRDRVIMPPNSGSDTQISRKWLKRTCVGCNVDKYKSKYKILYFN